MNEKLLEEAYALSDSLCEWHRHLHQTPEVGLELSQTAAYVAQELDKMNISYRMVSQGAGVLAWLGSGSPCLLLRADMDALPIQEEADIPYAATNGRMHACGHDMHATMLLGAAKLLKAHEQELKGTVKMIFQPGEETFSGALSVINDHILENPQVEEAMALHVNSMLPTNMLIYGKQAMSSVYGFKITLTGVGGHGSAPEFCIDPINTGVHIYLGLQELIARECAAHDEVALTIGQFQAGDAANIIPSTAVLAGTLRTFDPEVTKKMKTRITEVATQIAAAYRTKIVIETESEAPALICSEKVNQEMLDGLASLGVDLVSQTGLEMQAVAAEAFAHPEKIYTVDAYHAMGSEDFAFIAEKVPSGFMLIGSAVEDPQKLYGQHHPKVQFNEKTLPLGAAIEAASALEWFKKREAQ